MTDPIFLLLQITFIRLLSSCTTCIHVVLLHLFHVSPADLFHPSPHPHLKSRQSPNLLSYMSRFQLHRETHTPYYSFDNSFLQIFLQTFTLQLLSLVEAILSHANLYSMFLRTQNLIGKKRLLNRNSFTKRDESEILNVINENKMSKSKCQKLIIKCYW